MAQQELQTKYIKESVVEIARSFFQQLAPVRININE